MELMSDSACLLCKQQTTVLKLDNVKSYLDKLFDTFFDKSNIFKDEFQGMVANTSLCLMCTPKVNICCNLRNDYEDKYNGKCLQKLLSSTGCLLCDGNSPPLTKTQDMPSSLLQQIELFMNSTSFPESYSNSALCLTCIHSLNIWHEVRSSIMKLRQNDEVNESNNAEDSDATDIANFHIAKPTAGSSKEKVKGTDLIDSNAEDSDNEQSSTLKKAGNVSDDDNTYGKSNFSDRSRSESPSLINNKLAKKFRHHQNAQKLSLNKNVRDKKSLISDSSDSEIDGLNKIVEEIVESYQNEQATSLLNSSNLNSKAKSSNNKLNITNIDDSSDSEYQSAVTSHDLSNVSSNISLNSPRWISKRKTFTALRNDSSDSDSSIKEKGSQKLDQKLKHRRPSVSSKVNPESEGSKHKRSDNRDMGKVTKIVDSSDEEVAQQNTRKLKQRKLLTLSKRSPEPETLRHKKFDNGSHEKSTKIDDSSDEEGTRQNIQKLKCRRLSTLPRGSPEPELLKKKDKQETTNVINSSSEDEESLPEKTKLTSNSKINNSSDEERTRKSTQKLKCRRLSTFPRASPEAEFFKKKKSDNDKQEITKVVNSSSEDEESLPKRNKQTPKQKIDDSSDEEHTRKNTQRLKCRRPSTFPRESSEPEALNKKSDKGEITNVVNSSSEDEESVPEKSKQTPKFSLMLKTRKEKKSNEQKETTESEDSSGNTGTQKLKHQNPSTLPESETTLIEDSSDDESKRERSPSSKHKNRKSEKDKEKAKLIDDSSDTESTAAKSAQKLKSSKISRKAANRKSDDSESSDRGSTSRTSTPDLSDKNKSSDSENTSNKNKRRLRLQIHAESKKKADKNQKEASTTSDSSDDFETKDTTKKISPRKLSTRQQIVLSDSSDQESMKTVTSELRKRKNVKNNKKHDDLWLYLNKRLNKLQSLKKLHEKKKINLPNTELDDKFYKQLPYVLLEKKDQVQSTKTIEKRFPKIKLRSRTRKPTNKEDNRRTSRRINKSPITITLSDDDSDDTKNSSFIEVETLCCPICDKISKTRCEYKAHDLFHEKPDQVVINVVREDLKKLQKEYNRPVVENINKILAKYLDTSEGNGVERRENLSNGHSSRSSTAVEDENLEELKLAADSTSSKSRIPLPDEKSPSTSEDNSDCENIPNLITEKKRKLSILLNNSRDKSDNSSPNPKRVRFALDHKTSITNSQSTEDLMKIKSKIAKGDVHNLTL